MRARVIWLLRFLERLIALIRKETSSPIRLGLLIRLRIWRRGFLSQSFILYQLDTNNYKDYVSDYQGEVKTSALSYPNWAALDNKLIFYQLFGNHPLYIPKTFGFVRGGNFFAYGGNINGDINFGDVLQDQGILVLKPLFGSSGIGFLIVRIEDEQTLVNDTPMDIQKLLTEIDGYIVIEFIRQNPILASFYPRTTNTIRILTMRDDQAREVFVAGAVLRIGSERSYPVDSYGPGGLCADIDLQSGRLSRAALFPDDPGPLHWYSRHPDSGGQIEGVNIPMWTDIRDKVLQFSNQVGYLEYIGWDIVVCEDGFKLLEGNRTPGVQLHQVHAPLLTNERIRRFYQSRSIVR